MTGTDHVTAGIQQVRASAEYAASSKKEFEVTHTALESAIQRLLHQVSAIGDARGTVISREVPASAFANVAYSAQAAKVHTATIDNHSRGLAGNADWLDRMIAGVRTTRQQMQSTDQARATQQQQAGAEQIDAAVAAAGGLDNVGTSTGPVTAMTIEGPEITGIPVDLNNMTF